jgi:hypothetical protein
MAEALLVVAGIAVLVGIFVLSRHTRPTSQPRSASHKTAAQLTPAAQLYRLQMARKFWGVSIESHCRASSRFAGLKFPFEAAPVLPVKECPSTPCNCSYIGLVERRGKSDRRRGLDRRHSLRMDANERRSERPRRSEDLNAWQSYSHL